MRRYPVENHADAALVQVVDEVHEVLRRAVARARREVTGHLIAPGAVERMLHHRQQLDVREAERAHVVGDGVRQLAIAQVTVALFGDASPRAEVQLVDRPGCAEGVDAGAPAQPVRIVPAIVEVPHDRCGARRLLGAKGVGIGLVGHEAGARGADVVLVERAGRHTGHHPFPDSRVVAAGAQRVAVALPAVEIADDRDCAGVRCPHGEARARRAAARRGGQQMGAELLVCPEVCALAKEIDVLVGQ